MGYLKTDHPSSCEASVAAGWLLSFTLSLDDVIISSFVTGPTYEILPLKIYSMVKVVFHRK